MIRSVVVACLLVACAPALAQPDSPPPLVTDRPDQTESATVVPAGMFQLEGGFLHVEADDAASDALAQLLLRIGTGRRFELRVGTDGYRRIDPDGAPSDDGLGDGSVGFKVALAEEDGARPRIALIAGTSLPLGQDPFTSDEFDPGFRFAFSDTLTERLSLGYNVGTVWSSHEDSDGTHTLSSLIWTAALGISAGPRLGVFVELFGQTGLSAPEGAANSMDAGITWLIRDDLQFDASAGIGLSDLADDWFAGTGLTYRW